jgi:hypothetical protein
LLKAHPDFPETQRDLLSTYSRFTDFYRRINQKAEAHAWLERAFAYLDSGINPVVEKEIRPVFKYQQSLLD